MKNIRILTIVSLDLRKFRMRKAAPRTPRQRLASARRRLTAAIREGRPWWARRRSPGWLEEKTALSGMVVQVSILFYETGGHWSCHSSEVN